MERFTVLPCHSLFFEWGVRTVADHFFIYLFLRFAGVSYGRFMAMRYKFNLSTYVQEPLVIGEKGCAGRDLKAETLAADNGR